MKKLLKVIKKKTGHEPLEIFAIFTSLLFIAAGSLVSINRFWQYEVFYYDFGIFDHAIWEVSRLMPPIIEHIDVPGKWIFADHFSPSIFLLSPLFWLTNRSEILLFIQAAAVGLAGLVIFFTAVEILKNRYYGLIIMLSFYLFIGVQNALITDFHEVTVATLPLALCFYFIAKKKVRPYFITLIIMLGFKESMPIIGLAMAVAIFFLNPKWKKIAIITAIISLIWGYLALEVFIPYFSQGFYGYGETIQLNPVALFHSFFDNPIKDQTMFYSFLSFGFLPIFSPVFWLLIFQDFYTRFLSASGPLRYGLGFHYSVLLAVIMGISSIYGLRFLRNHLPEKLLIGLMTLSLLTNIYLYRVTFHGPLALAYNPAFYRHSKEFGFLDNLLNKVPPNTSIMTQNNLLVRFDHRKNIWLLRSNYKKYMPDYIVMDYRPGQNANDYFGPLGNPQKLLTLLKRDTKNYKIIYQTDYQYIFQHKK